MVEALACSVLSAQVLMQDAARAICILICAYLFFSVHPLQIHVRRLAAAKALHGLPTTEVKEARHHGMPF